MRLEALGLAILIAVPPVMPGLAPAAGATEHVENDVAFQWEAPANLTGTIAMQVSLEVENEADCKWHLATSSYRGDEEPLHMYISFLGGANGWFAASNGYVAEAHAGEAVDTREFVPIAWSGHSAWEMEYEGTLQEDTLFTFAGFKLEASDNSVTNAPFSVSITCDGSANLTGLQASREATSFRKDSMDGGVGARYTGFVPTDVSLMLENGLSREFSTEDVTLQVRGFENDARVEGTMELDHPGGEETWDIGDLPSKRGINFAGGPGQWELTVTRIAVGSSHPFLGVILGLDAVDDPDEILI